MSIPDTPSDPDSDPDPGSDLDGDTDADVDADADTLASADRGGAGGTMDDDADDALYPCGEYDCTGTIAPIDTELRGTAIAGTCPDCGEETRFTPAPEPSPAEARQWSIESEQSESEQESEPEPEPEPDLGEPRITDRVRELIAGAATVANALPVPQAIQTQAGGPN